MTSLLFPLICVSVNFFHFSKKSPCCQNVFAISKSIQMIQFVMTCLWNTLARKSKIFSDNPLHSSNPTLTSVKHKIIESVCIKCHYFIDSYSDKIMLGNVYNFKDLFEENKKSPLTFDAWFYLKKYWQVQCWYTV